MTATNTDWVVVGAKVAEVAEYDPHYFDARVVLTTIVKLTATQVVCANGDRFHRARIDMSGGLRPVGDSRRSLLPADDGRVRDVIARQVLSRLRAEVDRLCGNHKGGVAAVVATLDEITQRVEAVRRAISSAEGVIR